MIRSERERDREKEKKKKRSLKDEPNKTERNSPSG